jgi:hypothetical protein
VLGYDRFCPYGARWQTFRNSIQLNIHQGLSKFAGDRLDLKYLLASDLAAWA